MAKKMARIVASSLDWEQARASLRARLGLAPSCAGSARPASPLGMLEHI
jgi:hypothetical protein